MTRLFILLILFFANSTFAQVQAPDYHDVTKWKYIECDNQANQISGSRWAWHEDYVPVDYNLIEDFGVAIMVVYQPLNENIIEEQGEKKFKEESKKHPWLLIYYDASLIDIKLFEFKGNGNVGSWRHIKNFNRERDLQQYLESNYGFIY